MAQAYLATVLQRPNDARGRPRSVLKKSYEEIFFTSKPIGVYRAAIEVFHVCDEFLTKAKHPKKTNLRFLLAMLAMAHLCKSIYVNDGLAQKVSPCDLTEEVLHGLTALSTFALQSFAEREHLDEDAAAKNLSLDQDALLYFDLLSQ